MKKNHILSVLVVLTSSIFATNVKADWSCSVDGYTGPKETICLYWDADSGCYMLVKHHSAFFLVFSNGIPKKLQDVIIK